MLVLHDSMLTAPIVIPTTFQVFRNMVDAQIYAERTGHMNFEECEEEVREKTAEEKVADRAALLKRIKENKVCQQVASCTESPPFATTDLFGCPVTAPAPNHGVCSLTLLIWLWAGVLRSG